MRSSSTERPVESRSWPRPKAGWTSKRWPPTPPRRSRPSHIDPAVGLQGYQVRQLAFGLGLSKQEQKNFSKLLSGLAKLFEQEDCSIAEINPLILTEDEQVIALDAKVNFDSNAEFRHDDFLE